MDSAEYERASDRKYVFLFWASLQILLFSGDSTLLSFSFSPSLPLIYSRPSLSLSLSPLGLIYGWPSFARLFLDAGAYADVCDIHSDGIRERGWEGETEIGEWVRVGRDYVRVGGREREGPCEEQEIRLSWCYTSASSSLLCSILVFGIILDRFGIGRERVEWEEEEKEI